VEELRSAGILSEGKTDLYGSELMKVLCGEC